MTDFNATWRILINLYHTLLGISIKSSWAHDCPIIVPVSTLRVCWNWSSTASLEGIRSVEGQSNWNQTGKWYVGLDKSIELANSTIPCQCIKGVLESVVNCIPWRQNIGIGWGSKYVFLPDNAIDWFFFRTLHLHLSVRSLICLSVS